MIVNGESGHFGLDALVDTLKRRNGETRSDKCKMGDLNVLEIQLQKKNAIPITAQNVNGTAGQNGRSAVRVVDTGEHKFDGEVSLWRQVIEDVTALANTEKKGIAQINSAAKKMLKNVAKMRHGVRI